MMRFELKIESMTHAQIHMEKVKVTDRQFLFQFKKKKMGENEKREGNQFLYID